MDLRILGSPPDTQDLAAAVITAADILEQDVCYAFDGRFHFMIEDGWSVAISSDSASRIRVESCRRSVPHDAVWVLAGRHDRLAIVVANVHRDVRELV